MQSINDIQDEIIEDFSMFENRDDKYEYLIDLGKTLPKLDEQYKTTENEISGCQSKVWLHAFIKDSKLFFEADSNGIIPKGIISLLIRVLSGKSPKEIIDADLYFINKTALKEHLMHTRGNGLENMVKKMRMYAFVFNEVKNNNITELHGE